MRNVFQLRAEDQEGSPQQREGGRPDPERAAASTANFVGEAGLCGGSSHKHHAVYPVIASVVGAPPAVLRREGTQRSTSPPHPGGPGP